MRIKFSTQLILGSFVIIFLLAVVGYLTFFSTKSLQRMSQAILKENVSSLKAAAELELALLDQKGFVSNYLLDGNEKWLRLLEEKKQTFMAWFNKANEVALTEREKRILKEIEGLYVRYNELRGQVINFYRLGNISEAKRLLFSDVTNYLDLLYEKCETMLLINEEMIAQTQNKSARFIFNIRLIIWFAIGLAIVVGFSLGFLIFRTITRQLLQNEKMVFLGRLSAIVAHEIRNPLTAIKMRTQVLKEEVKDTSYWREDWEVIEEEVLRLERIVDNFISLTKPLKLDLSLEDINCVLENAIGLLQPRIKKQGIELIKNLEENKKLKIDRERMKQVFLNIFLNSLDAMPNGGRLEISAMSNKDYLKIEIQDTGIGISQKTKPRLFEPFFTTKKEGLGLGLSIVREIIKLHRGEISISSRENKGTSFAITLPLKT
jgi:signal transduction histidine kinase